MSVGLHLRVLASLLALLCTADRARAEDATREKVTAAIPKLDAMAEASVRSGGVPGLAIAVVFQDEVAYLKGFGVREAGKDAPVDANTVFQLASCSKPISSTIVAALVSDGAVSWDTRIADIDPSFRLHDAYPTAEVTVRDLFSHRSGLPGEAGNELESFGFRRSEILYRLRYVEPAASFRAGYSYSNFGLTEGAVAAAKAVGLGWENAADQKLFLPLGMTSSSARYADFVARPNRASLHVKSGGQWQSLVTRDPDAQSPAGGVSSNARDLARWVRLELGNGRFEGKQIIKQAALEETHVPTIMHGNDPITHQPSFYGLGWGIDYGPHGVVWGHAGAFSRGARSLVRLIPSAQLGIMVLSNAFPTGVPEGLAYTFFDTVFDGEPSRDWVADWNKLYESLFGPTAEAAIAKFSVPPASASPAMPLPAYTGTYTNDYVGKARVTEEAGGLVLRLGSDDGATYKLKHFDRDIFTINASPETPDVPSSVTFTIGPDGKADALMLEDLSNIGQGALRRSAE